MEDEAPLDEETEIVEQIIEPILSVDESVEADQEYEPSPLLDSLEIVE